jgi:hypothetical protein
MLQGSHLSHLDSHRPGRTRPNQPPLPVALPRLFEVGKIDREQREQNDGEQYKSW